MNRLPLFPVLAALALALVVYGVTLLCAAFAGFSYFSNNLIALFALACCLACRFFTPLAMAALFGLWLGWAWHGIFAFLFCLPAFLLSLRALRARLPAIALITAMAVKAAKNPRMTIKGSIDGRAVEAEILDKRK